MRHSTEARLSNPRDAEGTCTRRAFLRLAVGTACTLFLPGCRGRESTPAPQPSPEGEVDTRGYARSQPWRIGRSTRGDIGPWMVMYSAHVEYGITEKHARAFGRYRNIAANWDPNKQIEDIRKLLAEGQDLMLIDPLDTRTVALGVSEAMGQGVPVILAGSTCSGAPRVIQVSRNPAGRGQLSATRMAEQLGSGWVVVLHSLPSADDTESWLASVRGTLGRHAALELVEASCPWSVAGARAAVESLLEQGLSPQGYLVSDGVLARGAVEAHLERGLSKPFVSGADDWNGWLRAAHLHGISFHGLSGGADLGLRCVDLATQVLSGQPVSSLVEQPAIELCQDDLTKYFRPELSDHYWAVHGLPEAWIERMFRV